MNESIIIKLCNCLYCRLALITVFLSTFILIFPYTNINNKTVYYKTIKVEKMWQSSQNYVWSTENLLGKGAFGCVYKGANKTTGELVAVKTFQSTKNYPQFIVDKFLFLQKREFNILQQVNHENIIKLIAIEDNQKQDERVIIMQLCTGGSLYDVIDHPENTYGIDENEFLVVLNHITAGMKYLRANNLVHRDLKPGNILRYLCDDGNVIYKIGDFGAARELDDNQLFQSFYGTEEYLRPDLYEAALLRYNQGDYFFGPTVDLWSIGVTLYHVATGNIPFQAYGGRKNRQQMFRIISTKPSGAISGIQRTYGGEIEYSSRLPNTCRLSFCVNVLITSLLGGLLEANMKKSWNFDQYFNGVDDILSRKTINIFYINEARIIKIYLHPNDDYRNFQNYVLEQTGISPNNQIFLYKSNLILNIDTCQLETTPEAPLYLFDKNKNEIVALPDADLPEFTNFDDEILLITDVKKAKDACTTGYLCKRRIEYYALICQHFTNTVINFNQFIIKELKELKQITRFLRQKSLIFKKIAPIISTYCSQKIRNSPIIKHVDNLKDEKTFLLGIYDKITQLCQNCVIDNYLEREWFKLVDRLENPGENGACKRAQFKVSCLEESWRILKSIPYTNRLNYNEKQTCRLERIKIKNTLAEIIRLSKNVYQQYCHFNKKFNDWYPSLQNILYDLIKLKKYIMKFRNDIKQIELFIKNEHFLDGLQKFLQTLSAINRNRNQTYRKLTEFLKNYESNSGHMQLINEENRLLGQEIDDIFKSINILLDLQIETDNTALNETATNTQDIIDNNSVLIAEIKEIMKEFDLNFIV